MKKKLSQIGAVAALCLVAGAAYAGVSMKMADQAMRLPVDPKKKKAGEECKTSDECQKHQSCEKAGEKSVCTAPAYQDRNIPNT